MNTLRIRIFTRLLQRSLLGETKENPYYREVIGVLTDKGLPASKLAASTWNDWWHGKRSPSISTRAELNSITNNLASKWLEPSLVNNRLACHLSCFDLANVWKKFGQEKAINRAWEILQTVHQDWQVNVRGEVTILNGAARSAHEALDSTIVASYTPRATPKTILIDMDKTSTCRLLARASSFTCNHYEPLNPSSIIPFLLCYALEAMHSETGLDETISIDLTSAIYACVFLLHARQYTYSNSGSVGKAAFALLDFWINDNEVSESDLWTLNHALGEITGDLELDNLIALRDTYREAMKLSGLSVTELGNLATKNLTSFN